MATESFIPPIDDSEKHAAYALYMGGWQAEEIVERIGINMNTLRAHITRGGWFQRRKEIDAARREKNPPEKSALVKVFAPDKKDENVKIFQEKTGEIAKADAEHWATMAPADRIEVAPNLAALNKMHRSNLDLDTEAAGTGSAINISFLNNPNGVQVIEEAPVRELEEGE